MKIFFITFCFVLSILQINNVANAADNSDDSNSDDIKSSAWETIIQDSEYMPETLIVVDKEDGHLSYLERKSPLTIKFRYPSIHGEGEGDKQISGDLKTPEGIYFVTKKIDYSLDFEKYGSQAHALNYPNPVDRLRGKTGYGIWIHSKGNPIETQKTQGCVAIDLENIAELEPFILPGIPVVVAKSVNDERILQLGSEILEEEQGSLTEEEMLIDISNLNEEDDHKAEEQKLVELTQAWNLAWQSRSNDFFGFYIADFYEKAQQRSFKSFKTQKENVFDLVNWIYIDYENIKVLEGKGYYVTWFDQYYKASNHAVEGVRRLYWMKDENDDFKIVGMEFVPQQLGLELKFQERAKRELPIFIENWKNSWQNINIEDYATFYTNNAKQGRLKGIEAILEHKNTLWVNKKPQVIDFSNMKIEFRKNAVYVSVKQVYEDSTGYKDIGTKKLVIYPMGESWVIAEETWSKG